jgi:arylsulfatase
MQLRDVSFPGTMVSRASGAALALTISLAIGTSARAAEKRPNILFIMGDDIGWMQPSIYHRGLMVGETPNIDFIGNQGAMFVDYLATAELHLRAQCLLQRECTRCARA